METGSLKHSVDVVIPVYRPGEEFLKTLWMLKKQTVQPGKIILMITGSEGAVYPDFSVFENAEIHFVEENAFDHGGTRNEGVRYSDADYVLFLTQDAVPADTHLIEAFLRGFEQTGVASSYARQLPKEDCHPIEKLTRAFNYPPVSSIQEIEDLPKKGIKTYFCSNVAAMYDRKVFTELGGFPDRTVFNEDMIYAYKVIRYGYKIFYNAEAEVLHSHNLTGKEQFHRNFDLGVSQADHPEIFAAVSSEKEGAGLVAETVKGLFQSGRGYLVFKFIYQCGMKYLGYRLGRRYQKLSERRVRRYSQNKYYWEHYYGQDQSDPM